MNRSLLRAALAAAPLAAALTVTDPASAMQPAIALDGLCEEWPASVDAAADAEFLYFRLPFPELRDLLTEDKPLLIAIDADADPATGTPRDGLGVDFEISMRHRESWREP